MFLVSKILNKIILFSQNEINCMLVLIIYKILEINPFIMTFFKLYSLAK